jgi:hypothetical protein
VTRECRCACHRRPGGQGSANANRRPRPRCRCQVRCRTLRSRGAPALPAPCLEGNRCVRRRQGPASSLSENHTWTSVIDESGSWAFTMRISSSQVPPGSHSPDVVRTGGSFHRMTVSRGRSCPGSATSGDAARIEASASTDTRMWLNPCSLLRRLKVRRRVFARGSYRLRATTGRSSVEPTGDMSGIAPCRRR